jgi:ribonuclease PH
MCRFDATVAQSVAMTYTCQVSITGCSMDDGTRERALQWHLRNVVDSCAACELHPYCVIAVSVQVISEDGRFVRSPVTLTSSHACCSIESTLFNAVLCALLHAGIPLHRSFVSVTVAMCNGAWIIDPLASEEVGPRASQSCVP